MGWSWVRVSTGTSPKLRDCMEEKESAVDSAVDFEDCIGRIVGEAGGQVGVVKFEPSGKWARVGFSWDEAHVKYAVIYDLEGREVLDLLDADELDSIRTR